MSGALAQLQKFEAQISELKTERNRLRRRIRNLSQQASKIGTLVCCEECLMADGNSVEAVKLPNGTLPPGWTCEYIDGDEFYYYCPNHKASSGEI